MCTFSLCVISHLFFFFLIGKIQIKTPATLVGSKRWLMFATRFRGITQLLGLLMRSERENTDHKETVKFMHCFSGKRELVLERQVPDMLKPSAALLCADRGRPASQTQETLMHYEKGTQKQHSIICRRFGEGCMHAGIHPDFLLMRALMILIWCVCVSSSASLRTARAAVVSPSFRHTCPPSLIRTAASTGLCHLGPLRRPDSLIFHRSDFSPAG